MKYFSFVLLLIVVAACSNKGDEPQKVNLKSDNEKMSYTVGYELGVAFRTDSFPFVEQAYLQGLRDGFADDTSEAKAQIKKSERQELNMKLMERIRQIQENRQQKELEEFRKNAEKNKDEEAKFLEENKKKNGVVSLPSGIQYRILKPGNGPKPSINDAVMMKLVAKYTDGTVFDSSAKNNPVYLPIKDLIEGWKIVIPMMPVGSRWEVVIPSKYAYGEKGYGTVIPPYATLIFEMELVEIAKNKPNEMK
ncbi:MAG TPA: FKBP-type peptidyl-prolyl cis-trans isomerase [Candidatus Kapabacteria bacterium]|jgi:FKBP-type peptidyl-prolyl cis-trans isomerase FklB|nr:FKBP-type peptidyl-prolyl cis-trans isomerase [Candidatus Kapabacteria bacterium]HOQ48302.1 FKBP-type peptidyl-prolyl cis-trans isomerase [Candidatus Kapabacteria bacterium]HPP39447.1 FKBP-type peptidyl-prolyl cis-trans isomerase [Candidatus Kapabacteria bacterium]